MLLIGRKDMNCFYINKEIQSIFTESYNRVGSERLIRSLSSHTTVRTVRYTAVS